MVSPPGVKFRGRDADPFKAPRSPSDQPFRISRGADFDQADTSEQSYCTNDGRQLAASFGRIPVQAQQRFMVGDYPES